jgi:hypothetical protein
MTSDKIISIWSEVQTKKQELQDYWEELKKYEPTSYSFPFHLAKEIEKLEKELKKLLNK